MATPRRVSGRNAPHPPIRFAKLGPVPVRAPLSPRLLDASLASDDSLSGATPSGPVPAGLMQAYLGERAEPDASELERLTPEDRAALGRVHAYTVPALVGVSIDIPRTLEANREALAVLGRVLPFPFEWKLERPIFGPLHKHSLFTFTCDAPDDELTGQPMCLVVRGPVTHVEGIALDTTEGKQRLDRVQRSFSATTDFRATLRSFSMRARIERAVWSNVQSPFAPIFPS